MSMSKNHVVVGRNPTFSGGDEFDTSMEQPEMPSNGGSFSRANGSMSFAGRGSFAGRPSMITEEEVVELTHDRSQKNKYMLVGAMAVMAVGAFAMGVVLQPSLIPSDSGDSSTSGTQGETNGASGRDISSPAPVTLSTPYSGGSRSGNVGEFNAKRIEALHQLYLGQPSLGELPPAAIEELVNEYAADMSGWDDADIPEEFVRLLYDIRQEEQPVTSTDGGVRRLRGDQIPSDEERIENYRNLVETLDDRFPFDLVSSAFGQVRSEFTDPITTRDDVVSVKRIGSDCWVVADTSNSAEDWINNINIGSDDIKGVSLVNGRNEDCGCQDRHWWGGCKTYKQCDYYRTYGRGYDGFTKPWNEMRLAISAQVSSKCSGASLYKFTGYSRGGAIAATAAAIFKEDGVIPASKIRLITFGSPRTLEDNISDSVHADFETWRMVYKKDPVPSIPYGWMGYKHYGTMICNDCGYTEGRDRPNFSGLGGIGDHTSYDDWFPQR